MELVRHLKFMEDAMNSTQNFNLFDKTNIALSRYFLMLEALEDLERNLDFSFKKYRSSISRKESLLMFSELFEELDCLYQKRRTVFFKNLSFFLKESEKFKNKARIEQIKYFSNLRELLKVEFKIKKQRGESFPYWSIDFESFYNIYKKYVQEV